MNVANTIITALVTLAAVSLGGWLTVWNQDRIWRRDQARQWRDIRLAAYQDFLSAYRAYLAYVQDPSSKISAVSHPRLTDELMPFFDAGGRPYREKLEAARMTVSLVSKSPETRDALLLLMKRVRTIAAARANYSPEDTPGELFQDLFAAHHGFVDAARKELGLAVMSGDV